MHCIYYSNKVCESVEGDTDVPGGGLHAGTGARDTPLHGEPQAAERGGGVQHVAASRAQGGLLGTIVLIQNNNNNSNKIPCLLALHACISILFASIRMHFFETL